MSNQAQSGIVELFDDYGNPQKYRRVSARIPGFLEKYPVDEYAVVITATDTLSAKPGLLALYQTCIEAGKSFEEAGLPSYQAADSFLFTAKLLRGDQLIRQTSSVVRVREHKDYETGETAAFQRLLAQLGMGGEVLDDDENNDFALQIQPRNETDKAPKNSSMCKTQAPQPCEQTIKRESTPESVDTELVPSNLVAQIEHLASVKGLSVNEYENEKEAKAELKRLQKA